MQALLGPQCHSRPGHWADPHWWTCSDHRAGAKGLLGLLLEQRVPGRAEPVWFWVTHTSEQLCPCTGGSSNPFPDATRAPGQGLASVPSSEMKDGENVLGRRRWRRRGKAAALREMCLSNQAGFGNLTEPGARARSRIYTKTKTSTNHKAPFKPGLCAFLAGVFEIFYSSCITLPGALPTGRDNPRIVCEPHV